jgi:hypothetical protein
MLPAIPSRQINFDNNREARAVFPPAGAKAAEIVEALGIPPPNAEPGKPQPGKPKTRKAKTGKAGPEKAESPKAVILIIGGADNLDEKVSSRLLQLFGRGIARAAVDMNAVIIDGGTESGVMKMMGQGVADRGFKSKLIGVAPLGLVSYPGSEGDEKTPLDPNHSHFVLVEGIKWGDETGTLFQLMHLFRPDEKAKAHAVVLLAGGGDVSRHEVLQAVRQNLPLIVVEGSGGVADEIVTAWKATPALPDDPTMAEIIADGRIELHPLSNAVKSAERLIIRQLGGDNVLLQAWERFAVYDLNAVLLQKRFFRFQLTILLLGLLATALALIKQVMNPAGVFQRGDGWWFVYYILLLIPITLTILITATNHFKPGNKWLLLRGGAEAIKREIYKYRSRAGEYKEAFKKLPPAPEDPPPPPPLTPEQVLAQKVEDVTRRVMQTEVNTSSLLPFTGDLPPTMDYATGGDDGTSVLIPARYVQLRLGDQLSYYRGKTLKLERTLKRTKWAIFIFGGLGTLLAAINQQVWIALTTSLTAALATYLAYQQTENTLMKYNQASTDLDSIKRWWTALPVEDQGNQDNVDALVDHTEKVLQSELDGWMQQMQNALEELRKAQAPQTDEEKAAVAEAAAKKAEAAKAEEKKKVGSGNVSGNAGNNASTAGGNATSSGDKATTAGNNATTAADDSTDDDAAADDVTADDAEDDVSTSL